LGRCSDEYDAKMGRSDDCCNKGKEEEEELTFYQDQRRLPR